MLDLIIFYTVWFIINWVIMGIIGGVFFIMAADKNAHGRALHPSIPEWETFTMPLLGMFVGLVFGPLAWPAYASQLEDNESSAEIFPEYVTN